MLTAWDGSAKETKLKYLIIVFQKVIQTVTWQVDSDGLEWKEGDQLNLFEQHWLTMMDASTKDSNWEGNNY